MLGKTRGASRRRRHRPSAPALCANSAVYARHILRVEHPIFSVCEEEAGQPRGHSEHHGVAGEFEKGEQGNQVQREASSRFTSANAASSKSRRSRMIRSIHASTLFSRWRRARKAARVATGAGNGTLVGLDFFAWTDLPQAASSSACATTMSSISLSVIGVVFFLTIPGYWQRGRDSNSRSAVLADADFKTGALNRSATPPCSRRPGALR